MWLILRIFCLYLFHLKIEYFHYVAIIAEIMEALKRLYIHLDDLSDIRLKDPST